MPTTVTGAVPAEAALLESRLGECYPASMRFRVAELAEGAVCGLDEVAALIPRDGFQSTYEGDRVIPGTVVAAEPDGRYGVVLYVAARPVPLHDLGVSIRRAVSQRADDAGILNTLGPIEVVIQDVIAGPAHRAGGTG